MTAWAGGVALAATREGVTVALEIAVGPATLEDVQGALDAFWSRHHDVPADVRMQVGIAAAEIAANIVEHGSADSVRMQIEITRNEVCIEFTDGGWPAEVDLRSVRMPDEFAERGRGLPLAKAALHLLTYCRDEGGNHWQLVSKAFPGHGGQDGHSHG